MTIKLRCPGATAAAAMLAMAAPAMAQDGWDVETDAERGITVASVIYEGGVGIAVQCSDYTLDLALLGIPVATEDEVADGGRRVLETGLSADDLTRSQWKAEAGSPVALSRFSARFARSLKQGGSYIVQIPAGDGRPVRRMAIPLPSDGQGLNAPLTACGYRTEDPRDALPLVDPSLVDGWRTRGYDFGGGEITAEYRLEISCVVTDNDRVRDCQIESERPSDGRIGRQMIERQSRIRVRHDAGPGALDGHIFYFRAVSGGPLILIERTRIR